MSMIILRWLTLNLFISLIMKHIFVKIQFLIIICSTLTLLGQDFKSLTYRSVGPERGGRVTTVTGTAEEPGTFYLGASGEVYGKLKIMEQLGIIFQMVILKHRQLEQLK